MKRNAPLQRRTPLKRVPLPFRKVPLEPQKRTGKPRRRGTGPTAKVRQLVLARSGYSCERCGTPVDGPLGYSLQHRRARGAGGSRRADTNQPPNLAVLCGSATTGCHGWVESHPAAAAGEGWRVNQQQDPAAVPVEHWRLGLVHLTPDGGYEIAEEAA